MSSGNSYPCGGTTALFSPFAATRLTIDSASSQVNADRSGFVVVRKRYFRVTTVNTLHQKVHTLFRNTPAANLCKFPFRNPSLRGYLFVVPALRIGMQLYYFSTSYVRSPALGAAPSIKPPLPPSSPLPSFHSIFHNRVATRTVFNTPAIS